MTSLRAVSATDPGRVRTSNQDHAIVTDRLIAVADGMGGHAGGEVAARIAIESLERAFGADGTVAGLIAATASANRAIFEQAGKSGELRGMGTTLTAAALVGPAGHEEIALVNVGDSRAYLYENGEIVQLTDDHSLVEEMVRQGEITATEAEHHPHRHILTRALGIDPATTVDSWVIAPRSSMRLLICSDGLTNECTDMEIASVLGTVDDLHIAALQLIDMALEHGGSDNVTVVIADLYDVGDREASESVVLEPATHTRLVDSEEPHFRSRSRRDRDPARPRGEKIVTIRTVLFLLVLLTVLIGSVGAVRWFNDASYFVGLQHGRVAIFEGRPGGLLFLKPRRVVLTKLSEDDVLRANLPRLQKGVLEASLGDARTVVSNLVKEKVRLGISETTTTQKITSSPTTSPKTSSPTQSKATVAHPTTTSKG